MIALGVGIAILAIGLIVCLRRRKMAAWERESQITVLPVWTEDPINDRCEIFVSKESCKSNPWELEQYISMLKGVRSSSGPQPIQRKPNEVAREDSECSSF